MRPEEHWLRDIEDAATAVGEFLEGYSKDQYLADFKTRSAVLQQLTVIGEAAARLPSDFRQRHPEVDWQPIIAFRNRAIHAYFNTDWDIVWDTAQYNVPRLWAQVSAILRTDFSAADPET